METQTGLADFAPIIIFFGLIMLGLFLVAVWSDVRRWWYDRRHRTHDWHDEARRRYK